MENYWNNINKTEPNAWETGDWDGSRTDFLLVLDKKGIAHIARAYQNIYQEESYFEWYDKEEYEVENVNFWMEIPVLKRQL